MNKPPSPGLYWQQNYDEPIRVAQRAENGLRARIPRGTAANGESSYYWEAVSAIEGWWMVAEKPTNDWMNSGVCPWDE